jgi:hypothetical protein
MQAKEVFCMRKVVDRSHQLRLQEDGCLITSTNSVTVWEATIATGRHYEKHRQLQDNFPLLPHAIAGNC